MIAIDYTRSGWRIAQGVQVLGDLARTLRRPKMKPGCSLTLLVIRLARDTKFTRATPSRASIPASSERNIRLPTGLTGPCTRDSD